MHRPMTPRYPSRWFRFPGRRVRNRFQPADIERSCVLSDTVEVHTVELTK